MTALSDKGDKQAARVLRLLKSFDKSLTGILVWINILNMAFTTIISVVVAKYHGASATFIAMIISTILISVMGEIIPKMIVTNNPDSFIRHTSLFLSTMLKIIHPLTVLFSSVSLYVARPFLKNKRSDSELEEDDIEDITKEVARSGEIEKDTEQLVLDAIDFDEKTVFKCMQNWKDVETVNEDDTPEAIFNAIKSSPFSRLPVLDKNGDVTGVLNVTLFLRRYYISGENANVQNAITRPFFVKSDEKLDDLMPLMNENKIHLAVVHDFSEIDGKRCYLGIITLEDILEELVGEIYDERDVIKV